MNLVAEYLSSDSFMDSIHNYLLLFHSICTVTLNKCSTCLTDSRFKIIESSISYLTTVKCPGIFTKLAILNKNEEIVETAIEKWVHL